MLFFTGEGNFDTNSGAIRENDWLWGQITIMMTVPGDTRPEGLDNMVLDVAALLTYCSNHKT